MSILHQSIECILILIRRNKNWLKHDLNACCSSKGSHIKSGILQLILIHGCPLSVDASDISSVSFSFITVAHLSPLYIHIHSVGLEACSVSFCSQILKKFTQLFKRCKMLTSTPNSEHQTVLSRVKDLTWDVPMPASSQQ